MSDKRDTPPPTERTIIRPARAPGAVPGLSPAPGASPFPPPPGAPGAGPVPGGAERTVIAPAGGGSSASPFGAPPPAYTPPSGPAGSPTPMGSPPPSGPVRIDFAADEPPTFGPEPLVAAAGRLIHLASRLKTMAVQPDLGPLRQLVIRELDAFSKRAQGMGLEPRSIQLAHYILCAFIDDAVMSTPWGANSPWSQHSLLAAYHNDVQGGERLFQFAERMESDPNREPRLMELLYLCLSLGFEGRAALVSGGQNLLGQHRTRLAAAIAQQRGSAPDELSPQWRGTTVTGGRYQPRVPLWVICTGLALIGLLVFAALLFRLSSESSAAITALDQAVGTTAPPPAPPPAPETQTPTYDRIRSILAPDVDEGRLAVLREGDDIVIRLVNQGLFDSGSATPAGSWNATFGRLAEAANLTHGQIRIEGHTDNQQIRSLAFPSNLQLSQARASAVGRALLSAGLADGNRLRTDGYGDAQPIGDNSTADGRRENRRVEIRVANDIAWR